MYAVHRLSQTDMRENETRWLVKFYNPPTLHVVLSQCYFCTMMARFLCACKEKKLCLFNQKLAHAHCEPNVC